MPSFYDEEDEDEDEELSNPFARTRRDAAPWEEEAFPEAAESGDPGRLAQAMADEEAEDRETDAYDEDRNGFLGRGERDGKIDPGADPKADSADPGALNPSAPPRWKSGAEEGEDDHGDVPYELWEQVGHVGRRKNCTRSEDGCIVRGPPVIARHSSVKEMEDSIRNHQHTLNQTVVNRILTHTHTHLQQIEVKR